MEDKSGGMEMKNTTQLYDLMCQPKLLSNFLLYLYQTFI